MIFELPIYDISHVLNFKRVAHEGKLPPNGAIFGSLGDEQDRINAANHLILKVKKIV